jgi:hypothetical protein
MPLTPTYTTDASPPYTLSQANRLLNDMAQRHGDLVHVAHQVLDAATAANEELALMLARLAAVLHVPVPDVATGSEIDTAARLVISQFDGIGDDAWPTRGMKQAIERLRAATEDK